MSLWSKILDLYDEYCEDNNLSYEQGKDLAFELAAELEDAAEERRSYAHVEEEPEEESKPSKKRKKKAKAV